MRRAPFTLLLCAASALTGCAAAGLADGSGRGSATSTATELRSSTGGAASSMAPSVPWRSYFADARLKALIALALQHNRDLRLAALNVEQARAQAVLREADLWPTIQAGITGARTATNSGGVSTIVSGGLLTTAYEVDLFGRVRQNARAADEQFKASQALRSAAQSSLVAAVAAAHLNLQADEELLELTRQTLRTREEGLALAQRRLAVGAGSSIDVAAAQSLLQAARAALAQVQRQRALDESTLVLLVGAPLPADLPKAQALATATAAQGLAVGLSSEVLARRPDVMAAEAQVRASSASLEAARTAYFPRITLTGSYGQASKDLASLFAGGRWVWGLAPQLLQPLFDAGRTRATVDSASASQQAAVAQYDKTVQAAFKEVHDALIGRDLLQEQLQAAQALEAAEAERLRLAEVRHRLGAASVLDVLDAQRSLYAAQTSLIQLRALIGQNQAGLFKAIGGGGDDAN